MSMTETRAVQTVQSSKGGVGGEENNSKLALKAQDLTVKPLSKPQVLLCTGRQALNRRCLVLAAPARP